MKKTIIFSGGNINYDFALSYIKEYGADCVIGADRGIEFLKKARIKPDYIVGDFDSAGGETLEYFRKSGVDIKAYLPEKDYTDTQIALELAIEKGSTQIHILGGTGTRLDHVLGNIRILSIPMSKGIECFLVDEHNRIRLADKDTFLYKKEQFGNYVSLVAHTTEVTNLTLKGFYYPLSNYTMTCNQAMGISNEILENKASITFETGNLLIIESRD